MPGGVRDSGAILRPVDAPSGREIRVRRRVRRPHRRSRASVIVPSLRRERSLWNAGAVRIAGVDEVGVAPTSGAVVAAAVIMAEGCKRIPGVRDSKTLSAGQREKLFPIIRRRAVAI